MSRIALLLLVLSLSVTPLYAQKYPEILTIKPVPENEYSIFGSALAMKGDTIIIGAEGERYNSNEENLLTSAGAVYVYVKDGKGSFQQVQKITAPERQEGARFGTAVALWKDFLFIGATNSRKENNRYVGAGTVSVYKRDGVGEYTEYQVLIGNDEDKNDYFGRSILIDDQQLIVSAQSSYPGTGIGEVYVFEFIGGQWTEVQNIEPPSGDIRVLGNDMSLSGNTLAIAAHQADIQGDGKSGCVLMYVRDAKGYWNFGQLLTAGDSGPFRFFGTNVALHNSNLIISDDRREGTTTYPDYIYHYKQINGRWEEIQSIAKGEFHVYDLLLTQNQLFAGNPLNRTDENGENSFFLSGAIHWYTYDDDQFKKEKKIVPARRGDRQHFGSTLFYYNDYLLAGAISEKSTYLLGRPNLQTDILSFEVEDVATTATIDSEAHTVSLSPAEAASPEMVPEIEVSPGATLTPSGSDVQNFSQPLTYTVTAEDGESKQEWIVTPAFTITAIEGDDFAGLTLFPNPFHKAINIESELPFRFQLYDANGRLLIEGKNNTVLLENYAAGFYFLHILDRKGQKEKVFRLIKQ